VSSATSTRGKAYAVFERTTSSRVLPRRMVEEFADEIEELPALDLTAAGKAL
jgi:hypothetical protein